MEQTNEQNYKIWRHTCSPQFTPQLFLIIQNGSSFWNSGYAGRRIYVKESKRTIYIMFVKSYLFPPKCTPAILNNPVGKNPMTNGCFCKNRTTHVQILCLIPSTAIRTFMSDMSLMKLWSQKVWIQTPVVILFWFIPFVHVLAVTPLHC